LARDLVNTPLGRLGAGVCVETREKRGEKGFSGVLSKSAGERFSAAWRESQHARRDQFDRGGGQGFDSLTRF